MTSGLIISSTSQAMDVLTPHEKLEKLKKNWGTDKEDPEAFKHMLDNKEVDPYLFYSLLIDAVNVYAGTIVPLLLEAGANPNATFRYTNYVFGEYIDEKNPVLSLALTPWLRYGIHQVPNRYKDRDDASFTFNYSQAIKKCQIQIIKDLILKGANPNATPHFGSPLVAADGKPDIILMLIEAGADIRQAFIDYGKGNNYESGKRLIDIILNAPASKSVTTFVGIGTKRQSPLLKGHGRDIPVLIGKTMKSMSNIPNEQQLLHLLSSIQMLEKTKNEDYYLQRKVSRWYRYVQDFKKTK